MTPDDRTQLLAAAHEGRAEGWLAWEVPELIRAEARRLDLTVSDADVAAIAAEALGV